MFPPVNPAHLHNQYASQAYRPYKEVNELHNGGQVSSANTAGTLSSPYDFTAAPPLEKFSAMSLQQLPQPSCANYDYGNRPRDIYQLGVAERPHYSSQEHSTTSQTSTPALQPTTGPPMPPMPPFTQNMQQYSPVPSVGHVNHQGYNPNNPSMPAANAGNLWPAQNMNNLPPPIPSTGHYPPPVQPGSSFPPPLTESHIPKYPGQAAPFQQPYSNAPGVGPPQPRRISADAFPSAVEVIESNRVQYPEFSTGQRSVVPPLVTTNFACRDEGNCNPRFIRSSFYAVPVSSDLIKTIGIPFTITVSPFANLHPDDQPVLLSDMGPEGPVRCTRCRAYMNPFVGFIDGGRRFQCPLCNGLTNVPESYFAHLDHTGRRIDVCHRPELCLGSYELTTTVEYCKNNELPNPPAFIFILDVSQTSIRSGLVQLFCSQFVDRILLHIPRDTANTGSASSQLRVGFITYDHQLHFYSLVRDSSASSTQNGGNEYARTQGFSRPQMHIVADVGDVFVPAIEGFLVSPDACLIESLLHLIPAQLCSEPTHAPPDAMLGPAIQAGLEALRAANCSGKLFVFHSNLPTADGPGKLNNREDSRVIGTDKEKTLLTPIGDFYTGLGQACVEAGCSVDMFLFPNSFTDVATLAEVPRLTAGHLFKYNCFQADLQGQRFLSDLQMAVARPRGFNAVLRVRTSAGIRPVEFFGNFRLPNTTDVELACVDPDTSLTVEIKHDDKLQDKDVAFIQVACLYTALSGQRRLRIHNLSLSTTSAIPEVFRLSELDTHMNWLFKFALRSVCNRAHPHVVDELTSRAAHTLAAYRRHCSGGPGDTNAGPGELVLPQNMKLYPLYVQCLMKSEAFVPADSIPIDDRALLMFLVNGMDVKQTCSYLYPKLYPLYQLTTNPDLQLSYPPPTVRCSSEYLQPNEAYLLDNGFNLFLWLGPNLPEHWIQAVLIGSAVGPFEPEKLHILPQLDSEPSRRLRFVMDRINEEHSRQPKLLVVRSGDKLDGYFRRFLVEDRSGSSTVSYAEYLCHIHKEVCNLLR